MSADSKHVERVRRGYEMQQRSLARIEPGISYVDFICMICSPTTWPYDAVWFFWFSKILSCQISCMAVRGWTKEFRKELQWLVSSKLDGSRLLSLRDFLLSWSYIMVNWISLGFKCWLNKTRHLVTSPCALGNKDVMGVFHCFWCWPNDQLRK